MGAFVREQFFELYWDATWQITFILPPQVKITLHYCQLPGFTPIAFKGFQHWLPSPIYQTIEFIWANLAWQHLARCKTKISTLAPKITQNWRYLVFNSKIYRIFLLLVWSIDDERKKSCISILNNSFQCSKIVCKYCAREVTATLLNWRVNILKYMPVDSTGRCNTFAKLDLGQVWLWKLAWELWPIVSAAPGHEEPPLMKTPD